MSIGLAVSCQPFALANLSTSALNIEKTLKEADIDAALAAQKAKCPQVHEDAVRVWKKFQSGATDPNYTYRFWARDIVLWLRKNRELSFDTEEKVGKVFTILFEKNVISKGAERLLTTDVWSFLINREGMPERERGLPLYDRNQMSKVEYEV